MAEIFLSVVNMSISASYCALAVLLLVLCLRKAPRWITPLLFAVVAIRLICPYSLESAISLIPSANTVTPDIMTSPDPKIDTGIPLINGVVNPVITYSFAPSPYMSANPLQILVPVFAIVWLAGILTMLLYAAISYARISRRVSTAVLYEGNVYQSERAVYPFVLGFIRPKIYLPFNISDRNMRYVLAHERSHIQRGDHVWKALGFILLSVHWFNPLIWLAYCVFCREIELACDERVIRGLDRSERAFYSEALVTLSAPRGNAVSCPLAFGEVGVKSRVRAVLGYKKPKVYITIAAAALCALLAVCLLTNPANTDSIIGETDPDRLDANQVSLMERYPEYFGLDASNGLDVYVWQMSENSYAFGLLPHSKRQYSIGELILQKSVSADGMRAILSTYDIDEGDIYIVPWQHPASSYIADVFFVRDGEDYEAKKTAYIAKVREMLFGK